MQGGSYIRTEKGLKRVQFTAEPKAETTAPAGASSSPRAEADKSAASATPVAGAPAKKPTKGA